MSPYAHSYYGNQFGYGLGEIEVYDGPVHHFHHQGGAGIGRYFARAFKFFKPLISSGINAIKDQGIKSTGSIISQIGEKDLKSILEEEGQKALKNLKQKAINKLNTSTGINSQTGSGMPVGISALQMQRAAKLFSFKPNKKAIKSGRVGKKRQTARTRRLGGIGSIRRATGQIGGKKKRKRKTQLGGKRKKKRKTQIGGKRKCKSQTGGKKKRSKKRKNSKGKKRKSKKSKKRNVGFNKQLDIFD